MNSIVSGGTSEALADLPPELARHRVLDAAQSADFVGLSVSHWRRIVRAKQAPQPVQLTERRIGWRAGDLVAWLAEKATA
jgi:predicted DNA-binding transcriptional regulator AlpA